MGSIGVRFSAKRESDQTGALRLVVFHLSDFCSRGVCLIRKDGNFVVEKLFNFEGYTHAQLSSNGVDFKALCHREKISYQYCSVVIGGDAEQAQIMNIAAENENDPRAICRFVQDARGRATEYIPAYQPLPDSGQVLGCTLEKEISTKIQSHISSAGMTLISLELEDITLINYLSMNCPETGITPYLYIGDKNSRLIVLDNSKVIHSRYIGYGMENVIQDMMADKGLPESVIRDFFSEENDLDFSALLCPQVTAWMQQIGKSLDYVENSCGKNINHLTCIGSGSSSFVILKTLKHETLKMIQTDSPSGHMKDYITCNNVTEFDDYFIGIEASLTQLSNEYKPPYNISFVRAADWVKESKMSPIFLAAIGAVVVFLLIGAGIGATAMQIAEKKDTFEALKSEMTVLKKQALKVKSIEDKAGAIYRAGVLDLQRSMETRQLWSNNLETLYWLVPPEMALSSIKIVKNSQKTFEMEMIGEIYTIPEDAERILQDFIKKLTSEKGYGKKLIKAELKNSAINTGELPTTSFDIVCTFMKGVK